MTLVERKLIVTAGAAGCLIGGLGLVAWRSSQNLHTAYDTFCWSIVALAVGFISGRVFEKVGLSKQGFVPTPQGSAPAPKV